MNGTDENDLTRAKNKRQTRAAYLATPANTAGGVTKRPALLAFSGLAALFCAGVVAQVFLAGLGLLVDTSYLTWHTTFVHLLEGLLLVMLVLSVIARVGWGALALTVGLFVLIAVQYALIHGLSGPFRALHAVNSFALFVLAWQVAKGTATRGWGVRATDNLRAASRVNAFLGTGVLIVAVASVAIAGAVSNDQGDDLASTTGRGATVGQQVPGEERSASDSADLATNATSNSSGNSAANSSGNSAADTDSAEGTKIFAQNCSGCHGESGQGRVGPELARNDDLEDRDFVIERVTEGGGIMPAFGNTLTQSQIEAVTDHVRSSWGNDF